LTLNERLDLLAELGHYLSPPATDALQAVIRQAHAENRWFTPEYTEFALEQIRLRLLDRDALAAWADQYAIPQRTVNPLTVGLVMAGNIPLVGFHDWLCVFVSGHRAMVKLSEKDARLLPFLVGLLGEWEKSAWASTEFVPTGAPIRGFDAVIATGSNNTARYFKEYFGRYPHVIRHNRNSVAILTGAETPAELSALGRDIFTYFGLGCRNVSKLYVPAGYDFTLLLETLHEYRSIVLHDKYKNNFDYNLTLFILNNQPYLNNGCLLLREDPSMSSRIACVHYAYYDDPEALKRELDAERDSIQCVAGKIQGGVPFGSTQQPGLSDYPDGVDIMRFLMDLQASS